MTFYGNGHHLDDDFDDSHDRAKSSRLRVTIFAAIMISALLGGLIFQAWSVIPVVLGYWRNDYRLTMTEVSPGDCMHSTESALCVCGTLDAQQNKADFDLQIRTQEGTSLGKIALHDQTSGPFCHTIPLETWLEPGQYILTGTPRMGRNPIVRVSFTVPDNRPTF